MLLYLRHDFVIPTIKLFSGEFVNLANVKEPIKVDLLSGCFLYIRKKALDQVGPLDETFFFYGEDKDFCLRFWKRGWQLFYLPIVAAIHYGGASSSKDKITFDKELHKAQIQFWKKHYKPLKQYAFLLLKLINVTIRFIGYFLGGTLSRSKSNYYRKHAFIFGQQLNWILKNSIKILQSRVYAL